jgi:hypothetical protein
MLCLVYDVWFWMGWDVDFGFGQPRLGARVRIQGVSHDVLFIVRLILITTRRDEPPPGFEAT